MSEKDGIAKNWEVVKAEFAAFKVDQKHNWDRLIRRERNPFHIVTAFISTTYQTLPRTLTYLTIVGLVVWLAISAPTIFLPT